MSFALNRTLGWAQCRLFPGLQQEKHTFPLLGFDLQSAVLLTELPDPSNSITVLKKGLVVVE